MPVTDQFANLANIEIDESAANTLTFKELTTGAGVFEKMAMIIHRIEYVTNPGSIAHLSAADDLLEIALVTSNQITGLAKDKAQVVDRIRLGVWISGTPANIVRLEFPIIHTFSDLPSHGVIVPATNLYLAIQGTSLAAACFARMSIYFTYRALKGEEYWELVEATRALS